MDVRMWSTLEQAVGAAVATVVVYALILAAVRLAGRRTTAQMSAFDILVTVALGTTLASTALPAHPAIADGLAVLATLLALQLAIGAGRRRWTWFRKLVDFSPEVVVRDGTVDRQASILGAQLTRADVLAQLRQQGVASVDHVTIMVLEPNGEFSVRTRDARDQPPGEPWEAL